MEVYSFSHFNLQPRNNSYFFSSQILKVCFVDKKKIIEMKKAALKIVLGRYWEIAICG